MSWKFTTIFAVLVSLLNISGNCQSTRNWELGIHVQSSNRNTLPNVLVVNPQNVQWSELTVGAQTTSILLTATKVKDHVFQYGFQAGSITYGNGGSTFDVLRSTSYPSPPNLNLVSAGNTYLLCGMHARINLLRFFRNNVFRLPSVQTKEPRLKTFLQASLGTTFRQRPFEGALARIGFFPTFVNGPNGELGVLNRDFHDQAFFNGYLQGELIAQYRFHHRFSVNARMFLHAPFGNPLFKFHNEYVYNNQLIGSTTAYGPSSSAGFSIGLVYNIYNNKARAK